MNYAQGTTVAISKTLGEIQRELQKRGVVDFGYMTTLEASGFMFRQKGVPFKFTIAMPDRKAFDRTPTGQLRTESSAQQFWEDECKRKWRSLLLVIKAKLVAIDEGIVEFNDEFLAYAVLSDGRTAGEVFHDAVEQAALDCKPLVLSLGGRNTP